jgi:hypothetical protein
MFSTPDWLTTKHQKYELNHVFPHTSRKFAISLIAIVAYNAYNDAGSENPFVQELYKDSKLSLLSTCSAHEMKKKFSNPVP